MKALNKNVIFPSEFTRQATVNYVKKTEISRALKGKQCILHRQTKAFA